MSDIKLIPLVDYLRLNSTLHEAHLTEIRDRYRQVLHLPADSTVPEDPDEEAITEVAHQLNLCIDIDENRDYLRECVRYEDISNARLVVSGRLAGEEKPLTDLTFDPVVPLFITRPTLPATEDPTLVADIDCLLNIKLQSVEVQQFIHSFMLQDTKTSRQRSTTEPTPTSIRYNEQFRLVNGCLLDLFIRQELRERCTDTLPNRRDLTRFRLIEPVSLTDDFGTWQYDHWHGIFDLELAPHGNHVHFPVRWYLADNAHIHCRISKHDPSDRTSSLGDRPCTKSLEVFVRDVCTYENNGQGNTWLSALLQEDIRTFGGLANLRQSEWDNIRKLTMNAKKTLKTAVDRDRENIPNDRRQDASYDTDQEDETEMIHNSTKEPSDSRSELLANLHLIKLFICYALRGERVLRRRGTLPKIEAACLDAVFEEMRDEGFADDGLFPRMAEFFLPLTISEQELCMERASDINKRQTLIIHRNQLKTDIDQLIININEQKSIFWTYDDKMNSLERCLSDAKNTYLKTQSTLIASSNDRQQQQAQSLQELGRKWHEQQAHLIKEMNEKKKLKTDLEKVTNDLEEQLNEKRARLKNIETEVDKPRKYVDKQLVKPSRGLIMYGPPGTGKSEIISKLAVKLGIVMVGPPLAAGELNRPLVGDSERILIALCQRCYKIPYAMCCVSIDEIDSLAPKRDEDSSEGKVDKISVLLSLIEGIKDVSNLMILCATNRLHMMDEAFLRRMSGKFFVGRPSSSARITILKSIPDYALKPELLDLLSIASTNFSGAAVRALTRAITVKCIATQRSDPTYQVDYNEALKIADCTAQQYQIVFGSETLPRLLLRNKLNGSNLRIQRLTNNVSYTGRILVDLHSGYVRIEIRPQRANSTNDQLSIIEHKLCSSETNLQELLERLTAYGSHRNVQLLQLIDLNLLASQGAYDEKKVFETLKDRYDECVAYTRSMIVYDLDALIGVNKSESDSNMGRSTSLSVVNQNIYTYVRARFRDCAMEDAQQDGSDKKERWAVAVIREPFLLRQFSTDVQFTRTRQELDELEVERRKAEDRLKCVKCKDFYIENENKMGNCVHHDGFVYDNSSAELEIYTQSQAALLLNKLECDAIIYPEQRENLEQQKSKFKFICCDAVLVSGNVGGCKKDKHGFSVTEMDDRQEQRQLTGSTVDRLDQPTIQRWEVICRANEEYIDRWLMLLETRIQ